MLIFFFFQAEDGIRDADVTGVQTCALPIYRRAVDRQLVVLAGGQPVTVEVEALQLAGDVPLLVERVVGHQPSRDRARPPGRRRAGMVARARCIQPYITVETRGRKERA